MGGIGYGRHALMLAAALASSQAVLAQAQPATAPAASSAAPTPEELKKMGSLYLQCDGNPNNMAAGESIARFIGAVTLLALFAPSPEQPDASKRRFGEDGVKACTGILTGEKMENNVLRRLPLMLARALHRIEAKDYDGAVADVGLARQEAATANLTGNPYFDRSMGLSFSLIEYEALIRKGDMAGARKVNARAIEHVHYSYYPLIAARERTAFYRDVAPAELDRLDRLANFDLTSVISKASLLSQAGRFPEAAAEMEVLIAYNRSIESENKSSTITLLTAVTEAIAGNWLRAEELHQEARANYDGRIAAGKPEDNASTLVELFDFYKVLKLESEGNLKMARRNFAARSEWSAPLFGQILEVNRRLRKDATADEMFGALEKSDDALWSVRADNARAAMLETDKNNRTLFGFILPYSSVSDYERLSKRVWQADKSKIVAKEPSKTSKAYSLFIGDADMLARPDALMLHAALVAKARGKSGFMYTSFSSPALAQVRFGNKGDDGILDARYLDADAVIAELSQVIPSPATIEARAKAKPKGTQ